MFENEARSAVMGAISMALKDYPLLQRRFEVICKENTELKKDNAAFKETLEFQQSCTMDRYLKLKKAKRLLAFWVNDFYDASSSSSKYEERHKVLVESEQFIKEAE